MSKQAAFLDVRGLKCDAPGCDYREELVIPSVDLVGKPCPKCGASLLTEEFINSVIGPVPDHEEVSSAQITFNGTGEIAIGEFVPKKESS
jgi:hypothetical protein